MQVFINEKSLHGQFTDHTIEEAIKTLIGSVKTINDLQVDKKVMTSNLFFNYNAIEGTHLGSTLSTNKELQQTFFLNIKNASKWEDEKVHDSNSSYTHNAINYVETSVAELTERKIQELEIRGVLLNFVDSIFGTALQIEVTKSGSEEATNVDCSFNQDSIIGWLIANNLIDPLEEYDVASARFPPRDYQTVLRDNTLFQPTTTRNQGRKVYQRIGTGQLWVVDNLHFGVDAHIEVFDEATRLHMGISSHHLINVDIRYKINGRTL